MQDMALRLVLAASVSTRWRQEADIRRDGPAGQSQLAATPRETRSRPAAVSRARIGNRSFLAAGQAQNERRFKLLLDHVRSEASRRDAAPVAVDSLVIETQPSLADR